jgi:hypothetical protein
VSGWYLARQAEGFGFECAGFVECFEMFSGLPEMKSMFRVQFDM